MIIKRVDTITQRKIPVILQHEKDAVHMPLVLINHGTNCDAESMAFIGERLANRGFFAISIDALWHGKRRDSSLEDMLKPENYKGMYLQMLLSMAADMSAIIDYYTDSPFVDVSRVGMTGISQGGYVAFMTITKDSRITAAAPMIGSPDLEDSYGNSPPWDSIPEDVQREVIKHSPLRNYKKMIHTRLFIQSAGADTVVPISGTRRLDKRLRPLMPEDAYTYMEYPTLGHDCPAEMIDRAIEWLTIHVKGEGKAHG